MRPVKTLAVTSPHEKGPEVEKAQAKLARAGFLKSKIDGVFGESTGAACVTAKRVLGYKVESRTPVYGAKLDYRLELYIRKHKLPPLNRLRQRSVPKEDELARKALSLVQAHIGAKEHPPYSQRVFVTDWYGLIGAWCAMTGAWGYDHAGSKYFNRKTAHRYGWAYVPNIVSDARRGLHGLSITHHPTAGTGVCYDWKGDGTADHFGLFERWIVPGKTFTAIEGNTSESSDSNGGEIMRRDRDVSRVQAFIHVAG